MMNTTCRSNLLASGPPTTTYISALPVAIADTITIAMGEVEYLQGHLGGVGVTWSLAEFDQRVGGVLYQHRSICPVTATC